MTLIMDFVISPNALGKKFLWTWMDWSFQSPLQLAHKHSPVWMMWTKRRISSCQKKADMGDRKQNAAICGSQFRIAILRPLAMPWIKTFNNLEEAVNPYIQISRTKILGSWATNSGRAFVNLAFSLGRAFFSWRVFGFSPCPDYGILTIVQPSCRSIEALLIIILRKSQKL